MGWWLIWLRIVFVPQCCVPLSEAFSCAFHGMASSLFPWSCWKLILIAMLVLVPWLVSLFYFLQSQFSSWDTKVMCTPANAVLRMFSRLCSLFDGDGYFSIRNNHPIFWRSSGSHGKSFGKCRYVGNGLMLLPISVFTCVGGDHNLSS